MEKHEAGLRHNQGKLRFSLMDVRFTEEMVKVLEAGAQKYAPHNWKKGLPIVSIMDSLERHLAALKRGEDVDAETGYSHAAHVAVNAMFLDWMLRNKPEFDDRREVL